MPLDRSHTSPRLPEAAAMISLRVSLLLAALASLFAGGTIIVLGEAIPSSLPAFSGPWTILGSLAMTAACLSVGVFFVLLAIHLFLRFADGD